MFVVFGREIFGTSKFTHLLVITLTKRFIF